MNLTLTEYYQKNAGEDLADHSVARDRWNHTQTTTELSPLSNSRLPIQIIAQNLHQMFWSVLETDPLPEARCLRNGPKSPDLQFKNRGLGAILVTRAKGNPHVQLVLGHGDDRRPNSFN